MMIMTPVYAAYSLAVLGLVGGAPAQGGPGGGGHRASRLSAAGRGARLFVRTSFKQNRDNPPEQGGRWC